ncbi:unnamed protein product [Cladocopium goreaui]|uniref:Uncharacterized protein n=1 Tax=Cladocopium goreaui TaxID=2562237 RepID=A0A9P1FSK5_9DINO|nr:unnamed protein product [Cladocopium goreaui]
MSAFLDDRHEALQHLRQQIDADFSSETILPEEIAARSSSPGELSASSPLSFRLAVPREQLHEQISAAQQRLQRSRTCWRRCVQGGGLAEAKEERLVKAAQIALEESGAEAHQMKKNYLKERDRLRQRLRCQRMQHRQTQQKAQEEAETKVKALELRGPETPPKAASKATKADRSSQDGAEELREKLKRYLEQEKELKSRTAELQSSARLSEREAGHMESVAEWSEELRSLAQRRKTQRLQLRQAMREDLLKRRVVMHCRKTGARWVGEESLDDQRKLGILEAAGVHIFKDASTNKASVKHFARVA